MRVHVGGISSSVERKEWIGATQFFGKQLIPERSREDILINLDLTQFTDEYGEIEMYGKVVLPMIGTPMRMFDITINTRREFDRKDQLISLAHEMIHVEQIVSGRFGGVREDGQLKIKWNKQILPKSEAMNLDAPWEREAHSGERRLFIKYEKSLRYKD